MPLHLNVVSCGQHQKPRKSRWWLRNSSTLTIRADKALPIFPHIELTTTGLDPDVVHFYEENIASISAVVSIQIAILTWAKKKKRREEQKADKNDELLVKKSTSSKEPKIRELYVYVRDATGRIRSVYLANKIHTFLTQVSFSSNVYHLELLRKNRKK